MDLFSPLKASLNNILNIKQLLELLNVPQYRWILFVHVIIIIFLIRKRNRITRQRKVSKKLDQYYQDIYKM